MRARNPQPFMIDHPGSGKALRLPSLKLFPETKSPAEPLSELSGRHADDVDSIASAWAGISSEVTTCRAQRASSIA